MTVIGLIRHGITDWNVQHRAQGRSDVPLNAEGRRQVQLLADRLQGEPWETIISSPLIRARETAEIISQAINVPDVTEDRRICEIDCGLIEGTTEEQRLITWGHHWRELELGMERYDDVAVRGTQFLEEIRNTYQNRNVLVVSHGAVIGLSLQKLLPQRFSATYMDNASLTVLTKASCSWECTLYNDTGHLMET